LRDAIRAMLVHMHPDASDTTGPAQATVLFAQICSGGDIEQNLGSSAADAVFERVGKGLLREVSRRSGRVVTRMGHEFLCAFADPVSAARAAVAFMNDNAMSDSAGQDPPDMRIGFHHGAVQVDGDRVSGPAVYRAKRIADVGKPNQILVEHELQLALDRDGIQTRVLDSLRLRGQEALVVLHEIIWNELDATVVLAPLGSQSLGPARLILEAEGDSGGTGAIEVDETITIGRSNGCGLQIEVQGVSREHARIRGERDRFFLVDSSTNGTWLSGPPGSEPTFVRRDELRLGSSGLIGLGHRPKLGQPHTLRYSIAHS
jgi:adenylate cyclase